MLRRQGSVSRLCSQQPAAGARAVWVSSQRCQQLKGKHGMHATLHQLHQCPSVQKHGVQRLMFGPNASLSTALLWQLVIVTLP